MASRRTPLITASAAVFALAGGYGLYLATAAPPPPELAQAPMNITNVIPPAFIMAVDNSGSMTFHNQFPGSDGYARWSNSGKNFFSAPGVLRTSGNASFSYSYTGPRIGTGYYGIPPIDAFGFARSPDFNPAYFDPEITYQPWLTADGTPYGADSGNPQGNASTATTRIDPRNAASIALASKLRDANDRSRFQTLTGMVLPVGTYYRLIDGGDGYSCGGLTNPNSNNWGTVSPGAHTMTGNCAAYIEYWPATFYLRETVNNTAPVITASGYGGITPVRITDACGTGCHLWRYTITSAHPQALQNFANWYSFYGNRNRAMVAGMTISMATVENMSVGYFRINDHASYDDPVNSATERVAMRDMKQSTDRVALYTSMTALNASGSTPNRQAVYAVGQQFRRTDDGAPVKLHCQKNGGMLFTDGYSNQDSPTVGNLDSPMGVPFSDSHSNTMADIATSYYLGSAPIRSMTPAGKVPVPDACWLDKAAGTLNPAADPRLDCQPNLHMNFYGITLGGRGDLFNPDSVPAQDPFTDSTVYSSWPAWANDNRSTVDDIWHATVNTRGEFISARRPSDITAAMRRILAAVSEGSTPSGTMGATGSRVGTGSLTVEPQYASANNGTDWYGRLQAYKVTTNPITGETAFTGDWEASARIEAQGPRTIKYGVTTSNVVPTVLDFSAGNVTLDTLCAAADPLKTVACSTASITALAGGTMDNNRAVAYLRGSRVDEGVLRTRKTVLGDIVNSSPVVSVPTDDYGYRNLGGTLGSTYAAFLTSKAATGRPLVLFGANDGMLHVVDGRTTASGGQEDFAYIPATSIGHMGNLLFPYDAADKTDQKFKHRYFVDGPVAVSDVYYGGSWRTVAVGTSGAGGRSVFALDITNPAAVTVLWEINDRITGNATIKDNIGYVLGKPVIVPFKDAVGTVSWKAIFGNGYNSVSQQASLFMVDVATGSTSVIVASESPAPPYNGLGNISVIDVKRRDAGNTAWINGADNYADTVYAADQNGAVWKFDLLSNAVALGGSPLFVAKDSGGTRQSITGGLTVATGPGGGVMVYFGSGSFVFTGDPLDSSVQTMYGILDKGAIVPGRSQLQEQKIVTDTGGFRETTNDAMGVGKLGWYIDLPAGERFIGYPRIESGVVFFPTYEPDTSSSADCSASGTNWLYGLNALSGGAAMTYVRMGTPTGPQPASTTGAVALNTGGTAPVKDVAVMTTPRIGPLAPGSSQADIDAALGAQCSMVVRVAGAPPMYLPRPCGRQSWRQVR